MTIDPSWLDQLLRSKELASREIESFEVDDVVFQMPLKTPRGSKRARDWQRRLLPNLITDSVNADAPERTPFRILYALTRNQKTEKKIDEVFKGDLAPLEPLFRAETETTQKKMTLAFHVLAVQAASTGEVDAKGFTERTILLLCRQTDGKLNEPLLARLVNEFRRAPDTLDLAQRTLLERLQPGWTPNQEPTFALGTVDEEVPFDPSVCSLFQELSLIHI